MKRPTWDDVWMDMARAIAQRSLCDRDKVGAVIAPKGNGDGFVASYNGPPAGYKVEGTCTSWCERAKARGDRPLKAALRQDYSDCPSAHAEQNAITRADFSKIKNGTIYVTSSVCFTCAKSIANSGISRVVMRVDPDHTHRNSSRSVEFLLASGMHVQVLTAGMRAVPITPKLG